MCFKLWVESHCRNVVGIICGTKKRRGGVQKVNQKSNLDVFVFFFNVSFVSNGKSSVASCGEASHVKAAGPAPTNTRASQAVKKCLLNSFRVVFALILKNVCLQGELHQTALYKWQSVYEGINEWPHKKFSFTRDCVRLKCQKLVVRLLFKREKNLLNLFSEIPALPDKLIV